MAKKPLLSGLAASTKRLLGVIDAATQIDPNQSAYNYDGVTVAMLAGSGDKPVRNRVQIYEKWFRMMGHPIISTALRAHVTQALGGHETSGDTIFMEPKPDASAAERALIEEIASDLLPLFNREAHSLAFRATGFGDAYLRIIFEQGKGVTDLYGGELILPPLIQPYERGNTTTGYVWTTGEKASERLTVKQMARCKMKRMNYIPQVRAQELAQRLSLIQDDAEKWPHMPALVGGAFLDAAEEPHDRLQTSLAGLVANRILGSIDESLVTMNMEGMTLEQQKKAVGNFARMLETSKRAAQALIEKGEFSTQRITHVMPVHGDKAITQVQAFQGSAATGTISIDDVMIQARLLAGALGMDLALLGFADQLAGGLGEGGFFRTSVQAAERSDIIRTALTECWNHIVDVHTLERYGYCFDPGKRPYQFNYFGATSALDREQQETRERSMNATSVMVQVLDQLRQMGLPEDAMALLMQTSMTLDEDYAKRLAKAIKAAKPPADQNPGFGFGEEPPEPPGAPDPDESDLDEEPPATPKKTRFPKAQTNA